MMKNPRDTYLASSVATASPAQLLVMLYDRLALDLQRAATALEAGTPADAHAPLLHAQDIVLELRATLRTDAWDGAAALASLYDFLFRELVGANVRKDLEATRACLTIIEDLRTTWREAAGSVMTVPA
jgi:flagellar protein FliS